MAARIEERGNERRVVFDDPSRRNPISKTALEILQAAVRACAEDGRDLVLTGEGGNFSSGADLTELLAIDYEAALQRSIEAQRLCAAIAGGPFRSAALAEGFCLGKGLEIALACRLVVASKGAVLGFPEYGYGFEPGAGGARLAGSRCGRIPGPSAGWERIGAQEALAMGLVEIVTAPPFPRAIPSEWWSKLRPPLRLELDRDFARHYAERITSSAVRRALESRMRKK